MATSKQLAALAARCHRAGIDLPTLDRWYRQAFTARRRPPVPVAQESPRAVAQLIVMVEGWIATRSTR